MCMCPEVLYKKHPGCPGAYSGNFVGDTVPLILLSRRHKDSLHIVY